MVPTNKFYYLQFFIASNSDIEKATEKTLSEPIDSLSKVKCCLLAAQSYIQLHNFQAAGMWNLIYFVAVFSSITKFVELSIFKTYF